VKTLDDYLKKPKVERLPGGWATWQEDAEWDGEKWVGVCPVCRREGGDSKGRHLALWENGAFDCAANQGPEGHDHRCEVRAVLGPSGEPQALDPIQLARWREAKVKQKREEEKKAAAFARLRESIIEELGTDDLTTLGESDPLPKKPREQFGWFASEFYGKRWWAGTRKDWRFDLHTIDPSDDQETERLWHLANAEHESLTRACTWKPGCWTRELKNREEIIWEVVEHDKISRAGQIAIHRWAISKGAELELVIDSGGKSLHGLYRPSPTFDKIREVLIGLGVDANALNTNATRTPGIWRRGTDRLQSIIWIKQGLRKSPPAAIRRAIENQEIEEAA